MLNDFFVCPFLGEYRLGYAPLTRYSPYISKDHKHGARVGGTSRKEIQSGVEDSGATVHNNVTQMSLGEACVAVIRCLSHERDWRVLKLVLERIPRVIIFLVITIIYSIQHEGALIEDYKLCIDVFGIILIGLE